MTLLFIYGTLKRDFPNHKLLKYQKYIGVARLEPKYCMFSFGNYPCLIDRQIAQTQAEEIKSHFLSFAKNRRIHGELYQVTDECLKILDEFEAVDSGLFARKSVRLKKIMPTALPSDEQAWQQFKNKIADCYLFQENLKGAYDCNDFWTGPKSFDNSQ